MRRVFEKPLRRLNNKRQQGDAAFLMIGLDLTGIGKCDMPLHEGSIDCTHMLTDANQHLRNKQIACVSKFFRTLFVR